MRHDPFRSGLYSEFDYSNRIIAIYDLQQQKEEAEAAVKALEAQIEVQKKSLPEEVFKLYEEMLVVEKLKGKTE